MKVFNILYNPELETDGNRRNCLGDYQTADGYDDYFYTVDEETEFNQIETFTVKYNPDQGSIKRTAKKGKGEKKKDKKKKQDKLGSKICSMEVTYFNNPNIYTFFQGDDSTTCENQ